MLSSTSVSIFSFVSGFDIINFQPIAVNVVGNFIAALHLMKLIKRYIYSAFFLIAFLFQIPTLFGQRSSYSSKKTILLKFLNSQEVTSHFIYEKAPKDTFIIIVDSGKNLIKNQIITFGNLPIIFDTSSSTIDTILKKGIFAIRNRQRNYLIFLSGQIENKMFFSLYNPRTNGDCSISFYRRNKNYYAEKIRCGWF